MYERPLWPVFLWTAIGLFIPTLFTMYLGIFVDERWGPFSAVFGALGFIVLFTTGAVAIERTTYNKKPRGWRKLRAAKEREHFLKEMKYNY